MRQVRHFTVPPSQWTPSSQSPAPDCSRQLAIMTTVADLSGHRWRRSGSSFGTPVPASDGKEQATDLAELRLTNASRLYAYLSMAQFRAAEAAQELPGPHPPVSAAIGGASAAVLAALTSPAADGRIAARRSPPSTAARSSSRRRTRCTTPSSRLMARAAR